MKIFIAYASAGAGHLKAAEAIFNHLKQYSGLEIRLIDVLDQSNAFFKGFYRTGYDLIVKYFPSFWAICFSVTHIKVFRPIAQRIRLAINRANTKKFLRLLLDENPDYLLSTHFISLEIAAYLKKKNKIKSKLFTVITDLGVHSFWVSQETDKYFVACEFTKQELVKEGISPQKIVTAGIPIDPKFLRNISKKEICQKFGLDENRFTALIMTGSFGVGPLEEIVKLLHADLQILVVCARNKKLYSRLKNKNYPSVKTFAFIDNAEELMAVSDIIITKAGGLTISELLAQEVVPVFIYSIPGQERKNISVLAHYGIGQQAKTIRQIKRIVLSYKENAQELERVRQKIRELKKPFAAKEIFDAICQSSGGPTCRRTL